MSDENEKTGEETQDALEPPAPPLLSLDLGANGGTFAPVTPQEAYDWIQREQQFWSWLPSASGGGHRLILDQAFSQLGSAAGFAQEAVLFASRNEKDAVAQRAQSIQGTVHDVFITKALPHSSTPIAKQIASYQQRSGPTAAAYYASVWVPPAGSGFEPRELDGWRGLVAGLIDRFRLPGPAPAELTAAAESFDDLRARVESLLGEKKQVYEALHRDYAARVEAIETAAKSQTVRFDDTQAQRNDAFLEETSNHQNELDKIQKAFREKMALRAPVSYWEGKRQDHSRRTRSLGWWSFGSMIAAVPALGALAYWILQNAPSTAVPQAWQLTILGLAALFVVWAIRLLVRSYLSHLHLATDSAERVVMVQTYLSLLEEQKAMAEEDRKVILQSLFRPAADGLVKDEGMPLSVYEFLTRGAK